RRERGFFYWLGPEQWKKRRRYHGTANTLRNIATADVECLIIKRGEPCAALEFFLEIEKFRRRTRNAFEALGFELFPNQRDAGRLLIRQRPHEKGVDQTEDRAVRADRQGHRRNRYRRKASRLGEASQSQFDVI